MKFQYFLAFALVVGYAAGQGQDDIIGKITKCVKETVTTLSPRVQECVDADAGLYHTVEEIEAVAETTNDAVAVVRKAIEKCGLQEGYSLQCFIDAFKGLQTNMEGVVARVQKLAQTIQNDPISPKARDCLRKAVDAAKTQMEACLDGAGGAESP